jgi:glucose/arabinose dehydrogenase
VGHRWRVVIVVAGICVVAQALLAASAGALGKERVGRFEQPVYVTAPPGGSGALYVVERKGRIEVLRNGRERRRPFLDIRHLVDLRFPNNHMRDQGGLASMAFAPDYRASGRFYLFYTHRDGTIHVDEFLRKRGSRDRASPASARTVLSVPRNGVRVDLGGHLEFGPDGFLYAGFGYGRDRDSSQDLGTLTGKILRIDPRATAEAPYGVPADNPFSLEPGARPEIFVYGLRMPWRFAFDPRTDDLVVADVGELQAEEVDVLGPQDAGANLGWPLYEGFHEHVPGGDALTFPVLTVAHERGLCAIVGGYVIRGRGPGSLRGRYLYGDVCTGKLRSARLAVPRASGDRSERLTVPYLVSFGRDARGRLYGVSVDGPVYRLSG